MNTNRSYRVEAHSDHTLVMIGGATSALSPFRPESLLTREGAWSSVKRLIAEGAEQEYHTIKVFRDGAFVWIARRQNDGTYLDMVSCETVAP
jgi:hypothetical protein